MYETLLYEVSEGVATLTLNRPERHNAFNVAMAGELRDAWERIKGDSDVVCVIVTGAGEKAFCTGMDVADVADGSARDTADADDPPWLHLTALQNRCWKPVITALNGMVVGGGLHFVADSDLILAADHVTIFDTHVKVGLVAGLEPVKRGAPDLPPVSVRDARCESASSRIGRRVRVVSRRRRRPRSPAREAGDPRALVSVFGRKDNHRDSLLGITRGSRAGDRFWHGHQHRQGKARDPSRRNTVAAEISCLQRRSRGSI